MLGGGLAGAGGTMMPASGSDTGMMQHPRWCAGRQLMSVSWLEAGLLLLKILLADESVDAELDDLDVDAGYPGSFCVLTWQIYYKTRFQPGKSRPNPFKAVPDVSVQGDLALGSDKPLIEAIVSAPPSVVAGDC
ncbi:hypothetical protein Nepgr_023952 [Nepenthes gracilis]|uniref:Uncharacterized protein n=1 Tax=Nepenthes gracilis TaxID=150966 RepID=A0AAD3XZK9_NEPGR|nr:hypothetical protein Nepgr_023952 [Nepenthes gracilis]